MNNKKKIGLVAGLLLTPAAIVQVNEVEATGNAVLTETELTKAIKALTETSTLANNKYYKEQITTVYGVNPTNETAKLLTAKLDYLEAFYNFKTQVTSLKTDIAKLTLTSKTLLGDTENAQSKYNELLNAIGQAKLNLTANVTVANKDIVEKLDSYSKAPTVIIGEFILVANQDLLYARITQVKEIEDNYVDEIESLYASLTDPTLTKEKYTDFVNDTKSAYLKLGADAKKIADAQLISGTVTYGQLVKNADTDLSKAAAVDKAITELGALSTTDIVKLKEKMTTIDKSYSTLTAIQKLILEESSIAVIKPFSQIFEISAQISKLKLSNKDDYRTQVAAIDTLITDITPVKAGGVDLAADTLKELIPTKATFDKAQEDIKKAVVIEGRIRDLGAADSVPTQEEIKAVRAAYTELSSDQKKIVNNLVDLTAWEKGDSNAAAVDKKIAAIVISSKADFYKKHATAQTAFDGLGIAQTLVKEDNSNRLKILKPYAEFVKRYAALRNTDPAYATAIGELNTEFLAATEGNVWNANFETLALSLDDKKELTTLKEDLKEKLTDLSSSSDKAVKLKADIEALVKGDPGILAKLAEYRATYKEDLDASAKKLVTNIKRLTEFEKEYKTPLNVVKLIDQLKPANKDFAKKTVAARKAYDKLNPSMKGLVTNASQLDSYKILADLILAIENLSKSKSISVDYANVNASYEAIYLAANEDIKKILADKYKPNLDNALGRSKLIEEVAQEINTALTNFNPTTKVEVDSKFNTINLKFKELTSNDKKLVPNYKEYTQLQNDYKASQKVTKLIVALPSESDDKYPDKIAAVVKAYNKLTVKQASFVFDYNAKIKPIIGVVSLISDINDLKSSNKDYSDVVKQLRARYEALSPSDQALVTNYSKLEDAEGMAVGVNGVIDLINTAKPGVANYLEALKTARDAYDALSKDLKKQVTNYKALQNNEKTVKPVLALNEQILAIATERTAAGFIKKYDAAWKALDKISLQDRTLLSNQTILTTTLTPLYNVMKEIAAIKNASKTFVEDVKVVRTAYEKLTAEQKAGILNLDVLEGHEGNVRGGAYVDELIRALSSSSPDVYIKKVEEASAAYKGLSSPNKKAVSLYAELKAEEKYIAPVVQVIKAIDGLEVSGSKLDSQVRKVNQLLTKLDDEQYSYIYNISKYNNLGNVIRVVELIALIKPSDTKYYIGNTKAAEIAYNRLSPEEKQKVTNYNTLEEALLNVTALDQITQKIGELSSLSTTYFDDVANLQEEYKKLPSALKKQVTNYTILTNAEKDIKAVQSVIKSIGSIDESVRTFESKVLAARKAYDKLTEVQRPLVSNLRLLEQYERTLGL